MRLSKPAGQALALSLTLIPLLLNACSSPPARQAMEQQAETASLQSIAPTNQKQTFAAEAESPTPDVQSDTASSHPPDTGVSTASPAENSNPSQPQNQESSAAEQKAVLSSHPSRRPVDVTDKLKVLGQPFTNKPPYARNIWDMQVFDGKIYIGHGNSSNAEPAPNAGPIPIAYFDPRTQKFATQDIIYSNPSNRKSVTKKEVDEEQIDIFRVLDGKLVIPGHDARGEDWNYGNYYVLDNGKWKKFRDIPDAIHVYDMAFYKGKLFAAISSDNAEVLMSDDSGKPWKSLGNTSYGDRTYTFFTFQGKLYATGVLIPGIKELDTTPLLTVNPDLKVSYTDISASEWLPGVTPSAETAQMKIIRPVEFKNKLLYLYGESQNDHQTLPLGLAAASNMKEVSPVTLPEKKAVPRDILVRDDEAYVLAALPKDDGSYTNFVYASNDGKAWRELFHFKQDTFARSFEELNGDFYFGLGSDAEQQCTTNGNATMCTSGEAASSTGTILKVSQADYRKSWRRNGNT